jgi:uncharacterized protein (DUF1697 family)
MDRYLALLRGINVGGKNKIPMAELKAALEDLGYEDVRTYIQSGNVVLSAPGPAPEVEHAMEAMLPQRFRLDSASIMVLVLDGNRMASIVEEAPAGFGTEPDTYRYDVYFLKGITGDDVMANVKPHPDVDSVWATTDAFYHRRLMALASKSRLTRITQTPVYPSITVRNWNTTTKLLAMLTAVDS